MSNHYNSLTNEPLDDPKIPGQDQPITNADEEANAEISDEELALLDEASEEGSDDEDLARATLDNKDNDGEELNESIDLSGSDLDVPGSEFDDDNEMIGEEDEENNYYSQGSEMENPENAV